MEENLCVQCNKQTRAETSDGLYCICGTPECPNYGLVQASRKELLKIEKLADEKGNKN